MCLSVGLAAFILITRYVKYEKDWDKFNVNYERIYRVQSHKINDRSNENLQVVVPISKYLRDNIPEVENAITLREVWGEYLSSDGEHIYKEPDGYLAPSDVFDIFSFELVEGNKKEALDQPNSIVLNETLAEKYFPKQEAVGQVLLDERKQELLVTGIMKDIPEQSEIKASYFRSNKNLIKTMGDNWYDTSFRAFVLLKPNASDISVSDKIANVLNEHDEHAKSKLYLRPLNKLHLNSSASDDRGSVIYFYSFIGILTLLLSCISFMNLTTSFSTLRSVEIGIRKVSGSGKNYIRLQFLLEAVVLATISFVIALAMAHLILPLFNTVVNRNMELHLLDNPTYILFLFLTVLVTGFIAGSYPALIISKFKTLTVLKGKSPFKKGKVTGLKGMVYLQFILSIVMITSSLWTYKQVDFLKNKDLGFQKETLLHCTLPNLETNASYQLLKERILENPSIENMSISGNSPGYHNWGFTLTYEGGSVEDRTYARRNEASPDYLKTMGMTLVDGRDFSEEPTADYESCLINETAVKTFGWENPIGKWIQTDKKYRVVGVIKDFTIEDVHNPIRPFVLYKHNESLDRYNDLTFLVNPRTTESGLAHINAVLRDLFPEILFDVISYGTGMDQVSLQIWTSAQNTFAFFAVLAILISAMGLFGLVVFASQRRIKEIGIRKVQGASAWQILPLITKQFVILVLVANINVMPLTHILKNVTPGAYKYHFSWTDMLTVLGISILVTLLSSGYQAIKAARLNPVEALRHE